MKNIKKMKNETMINKDYNVVVKRSMDPDMDLSLELKKLQVFLLATGEV